MSATMSDRAGLYAIADGYMKALVEHDPGRVDWADPVTFTETGVALEIGDGLWGTISGRRHYDLKVADPGNGQVALFEVIEEHGRPAVLALRLKVDGRRISEVESVLSRKVDDMPFPAADDLTEPRPDFLQDVPEHRRVSRARMISLANGYFDTMQKNDGTLFTQFHDDCNRIENGLKTTNNPTIPGYDIARMGCADQFRMGQYVYDDALRARRFPLVDEERGVVLAAGFIDHSGRLIDFTWTDGTPQKSPFFYPHSFIFLELFKITDGRIAQVEAVFAHAPYRMPSPWPTAEA